MENNKNADQSFPAIITAPSLGDMDYKVVKSHCYVITLRGK